VVGNYFTLGIMIALFGSMCQVNAMCITPFSERFKWLLAHNSEDGVYGLLKDVSLDEKNRVLYYAAHHQLEHVLLAAIRAGATAHEYDATIFLNAVRLRNMDILDLLAQRHAFINEDCLDEVLVYFGFKYAKSLLKYIPCQQKFAIAGGALRREKFRVIHLMKCTGFLLKVDREDEQLARDCVVDSALILALKKAPQKLT